MLLSRLTIGKVVLAWAVFLWAAGLVLPQLGPHAQAHPAVKAIVAIQFALLLVGTPIALITYFNRAWRKVAAVPNRATYVIWMSLESIAAMSVIVLLAYAGVTFAVALLH
jgi:hypothetical protein